jgi:hypothetical protein
MGSRRAEAWIDSVFREDPSQPPSKRRRAGKPASRPPNQSSTPASGEPKLEAPTPQLEIASAHATMIRADAAQLAAAKHAGGPRLPIQIPIPNFQFTGPRLVASGADAVQRFASQPALVAASSQLPAQWPCIAAAYAPAPVAPGVVASPPLPIQTARPAEAPTSSPWPRPALAPGQPVAMGPPVGAPMGVGAAGYGGSRDKKAVHNEINRRRTSRINTRISAPLTSPIFSGPHQRRPSRHLTPRVCSLQTSWATACRPPGPPPRAASPPTASAPRPPSSAVRRRASLHRCIGPVVDRKPRPMRRRRIGAPD